MTETIATATTPQQRDEWSALHDKMSEHYHTKEQAESLAAHYLIDHIKAGGMAPAEFGLPSEDALTAYRRACEAAREAAEAWTSWQALHDECEAHPYTAELRARPGAQ